MMKKRALYSLLLVLFSLSCALPGLLLGGGSSSELQYAFEIPDNPFAVMTTLDSGNQAELLFTSEGGTLSVTGSDGTTFTLDVPAGALASDTFIRMTPVSRVDGMPFGGESYAVQFEPEGLQFFDYATLTIDPVEDLPIDQQIFFGYEGSGENLALALPVVDSREMKILLDHFSGYGVNKGLLADVEPVRQRIGGTAEARLQSAVAEKIHAVRQNILLGGEGEGMPDLTEFFNEFEKQVVKPRIAAAGESCAAGRLAIQTVMGIERQRQLLGVGEGGAFPSELLNTVAEVCMKEEYEMCRDDHIIHRIVPAWLGLERQFQLLGIGDSGALDKTKEYVKKCLTFELRFESQGTLNGDDGGGVDSSVQSKVELQFNKGSWLVEGQAPLENTAFEFKMPKCKVTSNRGGGTFKVISLAPIPDKTATADVLGTVEDIKMIYDPGDTSESYTVTCKNQPSFSMSQPFWSTFFTALHESEIDLANGGFLMEDWEILGNEYYAKKEWIKDGSGMGVIEAGTFKLYHKPEK